MIRLTQNRQISLARLLTTVAILMTTPCFAEEPDWDAFDALLNAYVKPGERAGITLNQVDYAALGADPRFSRALDALAKFSPRTLETKNEQLAFYINAYNLLAIKLVVDNWPLRSIKDIGSFLRPVWKRPAGAIGGATVTLDEIEHEILRPLGEPRMHFAIVCASLSCPDLRAEAYRTASLSSQLDDQTETFLSNSSKGLQLVGNHARVSKIFAWFEEDFAAVGGIAAFIRRYTELPAETKVRPKLDYDWSVNGIEP